MSSWNAVVTGVGVAAARLPVVNEGAQETTPDCPHDCLQSRPAEASHAVTSDICCDERQYVWRE